MKKIITFLFFLVLVLFPYATFSASGEIEEVNNDNQKTIKELKENINLLNQDKRYLNLEFSILNRDSKLKTFFRDDLASSEVRDIQYIINRYIASKSALEETMTQKAKNLEDTSEEKQALLDKKKEFYKDLVPFIRKDRLKEYIEYISSDVKILREKRDVDTKLIIKKEIINHKVEQIEEKIIEHKESLDVKFKKLIEQKISEKIERLKENEKFKVLEPRLQKAVVERVIQKIHLQMKNFEEQGDRSDAMLRKKEIYNILLSTLEEFKNSLGN